MNARQRHVETLLYGKPDRIPLAPGNGRKSTRDAWHTQGLPTEVKPSEINEYAYRQVGGRHDFPKSGPGFSPRQKMIPEFEEKVIERKENSQIVQDWKGNICEIGLEFDVSYLRSAIDFVTRRWIRCPVESRGDWKEMKLRYDSDDPARYPVIPKTMKEEFARRDYPIIVSFSGPYWQLREWCGFEGLSMMFYDDPALVEEMIEYWQEFVVQLMEKTFETAVPDEVHISEDMAYKGYSMVSPEMTRRFLLPAWKRWGDVIRRAGVPIYACDSDGYIGELIPIWLEAGINACDPIEVAAGNDIVEFRRQFGQNIAYRGGVDKREMAKGGTHIEKEIERILPVIRGGGFIPGCDHGVPSDVSWPNYLRYVELLAKATGWL
jgi:uroporphyrinogen decarboxylase